MITTSSICEVTGVAPSTLTEWVTTGVISPAVAGGPGRGNSRRFATTQAVGIAVAVALAKTCRGCAPTYVKALVNAFGAVSEEWLEAEFRKGHTNFVAVHADKPLLRESQAYESVNVEAIYDRFKAKAVA